MYISTFVVPSYVKRAWFSLTYKKRVKILKNELFHAMTFILELSNFYFCLQKKFILFYFILFIYFIIFVCNNFEHLKYICICLYGVHCGEVLVLENIPGRTKFVNM